MPRTKTTRVTRTLDARDWAAVIEALEFKATCQGLFRAEPTAEHLEVKAEMARLIDALRIDWKLEV